MAARVLGAFALFALLLTARAAPAVYRDVKEYGAKGDGIIDDSAAIIRALTEGRADNPADVYPNAVYSPSTLKPAYVFFPAGTYVVRETLPVVFYTQMVGDVDNPPTIKFYSNVPVRVLESLSTSWYHDASVNNFYRLISNFVIDMTDCPQCTGIHWQVAQATSINNVYFKGAIGSQSQGMWMDDGSGGHLQDLVFEGGIYGMWVGNQQFTSRNITIRHVSRAAIYLNWDWAWTFQGLHVLDAPIGVQVAGGVGSTTLIDADFVDVDTCVQTGFDAASSVVNTVVLDNIAASSTKGNTTLTIVANKDGPALVRSGAAQATVASWVQGAVWQGNATNRMAMEPKQVAARAAVLVDGSQRFFGTPRPYFRNDSLIDVVAALGLDNTGVKDVSQALQDALHQYAGSGKALFFPSGTYLIAQTVYVPAGSRLLGQAWSALMANGPAFQNAQNPTPMLQVGKPGGAEVGVAQIVNFLFTTRGAQPGAKLVEWNMRHPEGDPGACGMWDSHFRVGGAVATDLRPNVCPAGPGTQQMLTDCAAAWGLMHITSSGSCYMENVWGWTADHDIDAGPQLNIYTTRGLLCESQGPVWMYGTAFEHNTLYQYSLVRAQNVLLSMIQTETPYYQPSPTTPFSRTIPSDPLFCDETQDIRCRMAYALSVQSSSNIYIYGTGFYSFFNTWSQACLKPKPVCQLNLINIHDSEPVYMYAVNTYGSVYMLSSNQTYSAADQQLNTFCSTAAVNLDLF